MSSKGSAAYDSRNLVVKPGLIYRTSGECPDDYREGVIVCTVGYGLTPHEWFFQICQMCEGSWEGIRESSTNITPDDWREGTLVCPERTTFSNWYTTHHIMAYGRCINCGQSADEIRESSMPKLSDVQSGTTSTWGPHIEDKKVLDGVPFWIHGAKTTDYVDKSTGREVSLIVLDITVNDPHRKAPRGVITVGNTEERQGIVQYFQNVSNTGPLGPCITYCVPLGNGNTFWRIEDAPEDDDVSDESALDVLGAKTSRKR